MDDQIKVEVKEKKEKVAKRIPPGDRWEPLFGGDEGLVFDSLTDVLEHIYQETGYTKFYMDAREGYVHSVHEERVEIKPKPKKKYSLYGEH